MPLSEKEEFELLSLEREKAQASKPAAAAPKDMLPQAAEEEPNPHLVQIGSKLAAPFEKAGQLIDSARGKDKEAIAGAQQRGQAMEALGEAHPLSRITGAGTDVATGALLPALKGTTALGKVLAGVGTGAAQGAAQPVTEGSSVQGETAKQAGKGGILGGGLQTLFNMAPKSLTTPIMKLIEGFGKEKPMPVVPTRAPVGAGAEKATEELQRQRGVAEGTQPPVFGKSELDTTKTEFEGRTKALRDKAFQDTTRIDTKNAGDAIAALVERNPDAKVRAALKEVKDTIERATQSSAKAALPPAGTRMTPQQLKEMQGAGGKLSVEMADEVRQSINRMIEGKGDKALDAHTKDVLAQVRETLLKDAPASYKDYLGTYAKGAKELDRFDPSQTVVGKVTGKENTQAFTGRDAQNALEKAFKSDRPDLHIKQLVESTKHDQAAIDGVRKGFGEWLYPKDGKPLTAPQMAERWNSVKSSVEKSGMFSKEHFEFIDKMVKGIEAQETGKKIAGSVGAVGGLALGLLKVPFGGHMLATSHWGREAMEKMVSREQNRMSDALKLVMDEPTSLILQKPATPANISALEKAMAKLDLDPSFQKTILNELSKKSGEEKIPKRRGNDPLSMRPAGI